MGHAPQGVREIQGLIFESALKARVQGEIQTNAALLDSSQPLWTTSMNQLS